MFQGLPTSSLEEPVLTQPIADIRVEFKTLVQYQLLTMSALAYSKYSVNTHL